MFFFVAVTKITFCKDTQTLSNLTHTEITETAERFFLNTDGRDGADGWDSLLIQNHQ